MVPIKYTRNLRVEIAPMKDESVLFNPDNNKFCVLNVTAAYVWSRLEHPQTKEEISTALADAFSGADPTHVDHDVEKILTELLHIECVLKYADPS